MEVIKILIYVLGCFISFIAGGVYIATKEFKYAKKANYNCDKCEAVGCNAKFCIEKRK